MKLAAQATRAASLRQFSVKHQPDLNFSLIERERNAGGLAPSFRQIHHVKKRAPHPRKKLRGIK